MSIKKRIINGLMNCVMLFIILSVLYKLSNNENWLYDSVSWSIPWALARFLALSFADMSNSIKKFILLDGILTFFIFIATFIAGNLISRFDIVADIIMPFIISLSLYTLSEMPRIIFNTHNDKKGNP